MDKRRILVLIALAPILLVVGCDDAEVPGITGDPQYVQTTTATADAIEVPGVPPAPPTAGPTGEIPGVEVAPTLIPTASSSTCTPSARCLLDEAVDREAAALEADGDLASARDLRAVARRGLRSALLLLSEHEWRSPRAEELYRRARAADEP